MPASPFQTRRRGRLIRLLCGDWFLFGRGGGRNLFGSGNDGGVPTRGASVSLGTVVLSVMKEAAVSSVALLMTEKDDAAADSGR